MGKDATTRALLRHGVYSVEPYWEDPELRKIRVHVPYSFWAATKSILILSLLLWWIPTFGQMVAGYIGGRKAGSHWKAIIAAIVPVAFIWILDGLGHRFSPNLTLRFVYSLPGRAIEGLAAAFPEVGSYILFILHYLQGFALALQNTLDMGINGYMVTIIFAYIGGLMAEQNLKELEFERMGSPLGGGSTVVHHHWGPFGAPQQEAPWAAGPSPRFRFRRHGEAEVSPAREPEGWVTPQPPSMGAFAAAQAEATREEEEKGRTRDRRSRLDRDVLVQRLVERALRDYDRSG